MAAIDGLIGGGWPKGELSEIVGPRSSGRTSLLIATLASATRAGDIVALVDTVDRFDGRAAAANGVALSRLLWVRGPALTVEQARTPALERAVTAAIRACDLIVRAGGFAVVALDVADVPARVLRRLPAATWLRLAHANDGRPTACVLLADVHVGRSARGVSLPLEGDRRWAGESAQMRRFSGLALRPARAALEVVPLRRVAQG